MVAVDEADDGSIIAVTPGATLAVRLREQATTGYRWTVEAAGALQLQGSRHIPGGAMPGTAGFHEFLFLATAPGQHLLRMRHWRDWEGEGSIIGRWQVDVTVG